MGNNHVSKIVAMGEICLKSNNGSLIVLKDVRHIPDFRMSLISTRNLDDEVYSNLFEQGRWKLNKNGRIMATGERQGTLYKAKFDCIQGEVKSVESSIDLWHSRLGHMSEKGLNILSRHNAIPKFEETHIKNCTHCLIGKHHRVSFNKSSHRKSEILELVYSDIWAYVLKTKDQVFEHFKALHVILERETGKSLKCVRTDNGGEYIGQFDQYCKAKGIRHEQSVPKTPQHNGVVEKMNRTIIEKVRCILSHAYLSKAFWGEALVGAIQIINVSPNCTLQGEVPDKVWSGKEVSYKHLKVFGCRAFMHIPKDERSKLDDKSLQWIYLNYGDEKFRYKLYDPLSRRSLRSRDVVFLEDQTIKDFEKSNQEKEGVDDLIEDEPEDFDEEHQDDPSIQLEPENTEPATRTSSRNRMPSTRYPASEYILFSDGGEPLCYQEAIESDDSKQWLAAMEEEMNSLYKNNTYTLVDKSKAAKVLKNRWIFKLKYAEGNSNPRLVLGLAASLDLEIEQLDVKTAFLHGDLDEEIFMEQPEGFKERGKEDMVCQLQKSLYGLKQAPRQWYKRFDAFMDKQNFKRTQVDHCVYVKGFCNGEFIILLLYVDDMLLVGKNIKKIADLKENLSKDFEMKDLRHAKHILGMEIRRDRAQGRLWLSQEEYVKKVIKRLLGQAHSNTLSFLSRILKEHLYNDRNTGAIFGYLIQ
ncbi:transmembrane signal receptor [Lithospermum erythrorhizon]|uniref:Transmembrane signal receptor n=1 Tax=Lithospermum erythrorhizon TaxID=34254 RepID=A0AAV3R8N9_LITER